jgi:hypothetical protein
MNKTARIRKRLILLIAFSIIWVFIGSLVIFHQEHVMGKIFKWSNVTFVVPKSKDEKSVKNLKAGISPDHCQSQILAVINDNKREQLLAGVFSLLPQPIAEQAIPDFITSSSGLRAPPLA